MPQQTLVKVVKNMIEILVPTVLWVCFTIYVTWYFTRAKHYAPITPSEAKLLWTIHRKNTHCNAKRWREIRRGDKIVGFECECGYKLIQKRPIVAHMPDAQIESQLSPFDRLHASHNQHRNFQE